MPNEFSQIVSYFEPSFDLGPRSRVSLTTRHSIAAIVLTFLNESIHPIYPPNGITRRIYTEEPGFDKYTDAKSICTYDTCTRNVRVQSPSRTNHHGNEKALNICIYMENTHIGTFWVDVPPPCRFPARQRRLPFPSLTSIARLLYI